MTEKAAAAQHEGLSQTFASRVKDRSTFLGPQEGGNTVDIHSPSEQTDASSAPTNEDDTAVSNEPASVSYDTENTPVNAEVALVTDVSLLAQGSLGIDILAELQVNTWTTTRSLGQFWKSQVNSGTLR